MNVFEIWVLVLITPASLAYPSNRRAQSLTLTNDAFPGFTSHVNLTDLGQSYPVYPTTCFPPPSRGRPVPQPDLTQLLSDCYWIINEVLSQQDGLLFQEPLFTYDTFEDKSGNRYLSRWHHGHCVINVSCAEKLQYQTLQLSNVVLTANQILHECIKSRRNLQGGTTPIGSSEKTFSVGVLGTQDSDAANEFSGQELQRSLLRTMSKAESSVGDHDARDLTVSLPPSTEKRASNPPHGSSPSMSTPNLVPGGALSALSLLLPSTNLSGSVKAPPSYPVHCFNPYSVKLKPTVVQDCEFVINQIILRYPNPMFPHTFGYRPSADIDLSLPQNEKWRFGSCVMFVRNLDKTRTDTFRMVDVGYTAHRIMTECISGVKYPLGGTADVGTVANNFFVGVVGLVKIDDTNTSIMQYI